MAGNKTVADINNIEYNSSQPKSADKETVDHGTADKETVDHGTADQETADHETADQETADQDNSDHESISQEPAEHDFGELADTSEELVEASADVNLSEEEGVDNFNHISHDSSESDEAESSDIETNEIPEVDAELGNFLFCIFNRPLK